jgi:hypothetical protein
MIFLSSPGIVEPQWKRVIYRARIPDEIKIKVEILMQVSLLEKRVNASWNRTSAAQNPHAERLEKRRRLFALSHWALKVTTMSVKDYVLEHSRA